MDSPQEFNNEGEMKTVLSSYTFLLNVNDDSDEGWWEVGVVGPRMLPEHSGRSHFAVNLRLGHLHHLEGSPLDKVLRQRIALRRGQVHEGLHGSQLPELSPAQAPPLRLGVFVFISTLTILVLR